jgi:hypothetical protein
MAGLDIYKRQPTNIKRVYSLLAAAGTAVLYM